MIFYRPNFIGGKMKVYDKKVIDGKDIEVIALALPKDNGKEFMIECEEFAKSKCQFLYSQDEFAALKVKEAEKKAK